MSCHNFKSSHIVYDVYFEPYYNSNSTHNQVQHFPYLCHNSFDFGVQAYAVGATFEGTPPTFSPELQS